MVNSLTGTEPEVESGERRRIEFNFPILTVRTQWFGGVFDKLGALRVSRWVSWGSLFVVPIIVGLGLYLLIAGLIGFLLNPAAKSHEKLSRSQHPDTQLCIQILKLFYLINQLVWLICEV